MSTRARQDVPMRPPQKRHRTHVTGPAKICGYTAWVYFVTGSGRVKIGLTSGAPSERFASLSTMSPSPLQLAAVIPGSSDVETELHRRFAEHRSHGEWFHLVAELRGEIARAVDSYGPPNDFGIPKHLADLWDAEFAALREERDLLTRRQNDASRYRFISKHGTTEAIRRHAALMYEHTRVILEREP